jgi:hypothetical protein
MGAVSPQEECMSKILAAFLVSGLAVASTNARR